MTKDVISELGILVKVACITKSGLFVMIDGLLQVRNSCWGSMHYKARLIQLCKQI